jgi:hypothetical protein
LSSAPLLSTYGTTPANNLTKLASARFNNREKFGNSVLKDGEVAEKDDGFDTFSGTITSVANANKSMEKNEIIFWVVWFIITIGGLAGMLFGIVQNSIILAQYPTQSASYGGTNNYWDDVR